MHFKRMQRKHHFTMIFSIVIFLGTIGLALLLFGLFGDYSLVTICMVFALGSYTIIRDLSLLTIPRQVQDWASLGGLVILSSAQDKSVFSTCPLSEASMSMQVLSGDHAQIT